MIEALVRRSECVPYSSHRNPIAVTHSSTSRAYCRVLMAAERSICSGRRSHRPCHHGARAKRASWHVRQPLAQIDRATCFLLNHDRAGSNLRASYQGADLNLDEIAPTQLAIDGKIEQRPITRPRDQERSGSPKLGVASTLVLRRPSSLHSKHVAPAPQGRTAKVP